MTEKPLVSIGCITYNHAPYIRQCIEGFLMQKTDFPFEIIINDDCSTDGTTEIIKEYEKQYPNLINAIYHSENQYSKGVRGIFVKYVIPKVRGKYIAMCEGDDYWTDPYKLQKQVDILESHPEIGMVYTKVLRRIEKENRIDGEWGERGDIKKLYLCASFIPTLSVCYRRDMLIEFGKIIENDPRFLLGDVPLWLFFFESSRVFFLPEVTGVYRELEESVSHSRDFYRRTRFIESGFNCRYFYANKYGHTDIAKQVIRVKLMNLITLSLKYNHPLKVGIFRQLIIYKIFEIKIWIYALFCSNRWGRYIINTIRKKRVELTN